MMIEDDDEFNIRELFEPVGADETKAHIARLDEAMVAITSVMRNKGPKGNGDLLFALVKIKGVRDSLAREYHCLGGGGDDGR